MTDVSADLRQVVTNALRRQLPASAKGVEHRPDKRPILTVTHENGPAAGAGPDMLHHAHLSADNPVFRILAGGQGPFRPEHVCRFQPETRDAQTILSPCDMRLGRESHRLNERLVSGSLTSTSAMSLVEASSSNGG